LKLFFFFLLITTCLNSESAGKDKVVGNKDTLGGNVAHSRNQEEVDVLRYVYVTIQNTICFEGRRLINCTSCRVEEDESQNQPTFNSSHVASSTKETTISNDECPCMRDKPFLHVMAPGFGQDGIPSAKKPWKERYAL
jgi:hypothetical protein